MAETKFMKDIREALSKMAGCEVTGNNLKEMLDCVEKHASGGSVVDKRGTLISEGTIIPAGTKLTKENVSDLTNNSAGYTYRVVDRTDFKGSFGWIESQQKFSYYAPSYMNSGSQQQYLDEIVFEEDVEVYSIPLMSGPQNIYLEAVMTVQEAYDKLKGRISSNHSTLLIRINTLQTNYNTLQSNYNSLANRVTALEQTE